MRFSRFLTAAALCMVIAGPLNAGVLSSAITINGTRDNLNDRSFSVLIDVDNDGKYSIDDVIYGYLRVDTVNNDVDTTTAGTPIAGTGTASTPAGELGLIYSAQITAIADGGIPDGGTFPDTLGDTFSLSATAAGSDFSLLNILDPTLASEIGSELSNAAETVFVAVSSTTSPVIGGTGLNSVSDFTGADFDLELAAGIAAGSDDFFHVAQSDMFDNFGGTEAAGFTIFDQPGLGSSIFVPVGVDSDFTPTSQDISFHDLVLFGGEVSFESFTTVTENGTTYSAVALTNHSNFGINAVPEPTSLAAWGVLLGLGGFTRRRRKTESAA